MTSESLKRGASPTLFIEVNENPYSLYQVEYEDRHAQRKLDGSHLIRLRDEYYKPAGDRRLLLELTDLLGGPVGEGLGARRAGAASRLQQVQQHARLQQRQHALPEHRAQVAGQACDHRHVPVGALRLARHLHHERHDGRHVRLHQRHVRPHLRVTIIKFS